MLRLLIGYLKHSSKKDTKEAIINPLPGEWNEKSLNFWSLILHIKPGRLERIIKK